MNYRKYMSQVKLQKGDKVTYIFPNKTVYTPNTNKKVSFEKLISEKGIVKSVKGNYSQVVFNCASNWSNYDMYTAERVHNKYLVKGWNE